MLRFLWDLWEKLFARLYHVRKIEGGEKGGILRWNPRRHRGAAQTLDDGTVVRDGDVVGEIHFDNERVLELSAATSNEAGAALAVARAMAESLGDLAQAVEDGRIGPEVKCFWGLSVFHRGAARMGFQVEPVKGFYRREVIGRFEKLVVSVYHQEGVRRLARGRAGLVPMEIWLSRTTLLERYGGGRREGLRHRRRAKTAPGRGENEETDS